MKKIIVYALVSVAIITAACEKKNDTNSTNSNEVNATVIISPTSTININAKGSKALFGCANPWGGSNFIAGTNENNAAVYISIPILPLGTCLTSPGTYNAGGSYRENVLDNNTTTFASNGINPGSITFTTVNDHYWEGYFNAVCRCVTPIPGSCMSGDSVIIIGTFKGNF